MENSLVSVVMPVYNCEKYIGQAIDSVLRQCVEWELIIVNDCSTDKTNQVIQNYLTDQRIVYIENTENIGVAASRNKGVAVAQGKYIAFLDADDYWTDDKLLVQLELMEHKRAVLSSTARELMREDGEFTGKILPIKEEISYKQLLKGNCLNTSGVMIRADVAREFPMTQDHLHEDYITWLLVLKKYGIAYGINEPMLKYRLMMGTKSGNKIKSAKMTYGVYRAIGLNVFQSVYYFIQYAINGVMKYL